MTLRHRHSWALRRSLNGTEGDSTSLARALVLASADGASAINGQLASAGKRRRDTDDVIAQAEQRLAELKRAQASAESGRVGLANFKCVFSFLQRYEQRELVRLVLKQTQVGDRDLVLQLYGGALGELSPTSPLLRRTQARATGRCVSGLEWRCVEIRESHQTLRKRRRPRRSVPCRGLRADGWVPGSERLREDNRDALDLRAGAAG